MFLRTLQNLLPQKVPTNMAVAPAGRALLDSDALLRRVGLGADMVYVDLGAGALGHFVLPATQIVGTSGEVFAVDILKPALDGIRSRARLYSVTNLTLIWGDMEKPHGVNIKDGTAHIVSLVNVASVIRESKTVLEEAKRLLRKGGSILIIGWESSAPFFGTPIEKRVGIDEMKTIAIAAGLRVVDELRAGPHHWGVILKK